MDCKETPLITGQMAFNKKFGRQETDSLTKKLVQLGIAWDREKGFETQAAPAILLSVLLGFIRTPYWFALSGLLSLLLLQHAVQGRVQNPLSEESDE